MRVHFDVFHQVELAAEGLRAVRPFTCVAPTSVDILVRIQVLLLAESFVAILVQVW